MPSCIPGGSSSGSAVAVAAGLVDFAIGEFSLLAYQVIIHSTYGILSTVLIESVFLFVCLGVCIIWSFVLLIQVCECGKVWVFL